MAIAALIQVHKRPDLLETLLNHLQPDCWNAYVHVDLKSNAGNFLSTSKSATFVEPRQKIYWGGFSQVAASLLLLNTAYRNSANTHFYLMSGQCFPIKSDIEIMNAIEASAHGGNFMTSVAMPTEEKPLWRIRKWHFNDVGSVVLHSLLRRAGRYLPRRNLNRLFPGISFYAGDSWWLLNRASVGRILQFLVENPWYLEGFTKSHCPDECFFQTLVAHLGIGLDGDCPTASRWTQGDAHPQTITPDLLKELAAGWHFFARKFN